MKEDIETSLSERMKRNYEDRTRISIPRRTYSIIRLDGKGFHEYTRRIDSLMPFDEVLMSRMDITARFLCSNIQGAQMAYVQSDEISILVADFENKNTQSWFDGNIQKVASVSASLATGFFNSIPSGIFPDTVYSHVDKYKSHTVEDWALVADKELAFFDSRVFSIPDPVEVFNYFTWRIKDWQSNSIQMLARKHYDQKDLHGKNEHALHEMIRAAGDDWTKCTDYIKYGRVIDRHVGGMWNVFPGPDLSNEEQKEAFKKLIPSHGY